MHIEKGEDNVNVEKELGLMWLQAKECERQLVEEGSGVSFRIPRGKTALLTS